MELNRRDFLKLSGAGTGSLLLYGILGGDKALAFSKRIPLRKRIGERATIRPYCGVGCSAIMSVEDVKITNIEGDPDSPTPIPQAVFLRHSWGTSSAASCGPSCPTSCRFAW
jgi:anaerobic selenocysteine-containing dehydrogenase